MKKTKETKGMVDLEGEPGTGKSMTAHPLFRPARMGIPDLEITPEIVRDVTAKLLSGDDPDEPEKYKVSAIEIAWMKVRIRVLFWCFRLLLKTAKILAYVAIDITHEKWNISPEDVAANVDQEKISQILEDLVALN